MKTINAICFCIAALSVGAATSIGEGLLGSKYIDVGVGLDEDAEDFNFGLGANLNLIEATGNYGMDLSFGVASDEGGDTTGLGAELVFFWPQAGANPVSYYVAPSLAYFDIDFFDDTFAYGLDLGVEFELDDQTNFDASIGYIDFEELSSDGIIGTLELNRWFSETFNAGLSLSYSDLSEEFSYRLTGRFRF